MSTYVRFSYTVLVHRLRFLGQVSQYRNILKALKGSEYRTIVRFIVFNAAVKNSSPRTSYLCGVRVRNQTPRGISAKVEHLGGKLSLDIATG